MTPKLSIVIPVYNSEACLNELVSQTKEALHSTSFEMILVDDASTDRSWELIETLSQSQSFVRGIRLRKNSGQDNAIMAGLRASQGEFIAVMDDDLQHSPHDIPKLLNACEANNVDVCFARFPRKRQALWKNFGSWLNGKVAQWHLGKRHNVYLSPFKVMRNDLAQEIIRYEGSFPYVDGILLSLTENYTQIAIDHHKRHSGKSNYTLTKSMHVFFKMFFSFSIVPLRLAILFGILCSISSFGLSIYYLYEYFYQPHSVEGWTSLMLVLLMVSGLILISLGVIGEYLGRLYLKVNYFPQYTVGKKTGFDSPSEKKAA